MICPVEIADDMSALRVVRMGDHAEHGSLSEAAMERAMKVQDVMLQRDGEEDHVVAGGGDTGHQRPAHAADSGTLAATLAHNSHRAKLRTSDSRAQTCCHDAIQRNSQSLTFCPPSSSKMFLFRPLEPIREGRLSHSQLHKIESAIRKDWRRGSESNRRIKVLQTLNQKLQPPLASE